MAGSASILDDAQERARWEGFAWTDENARKAQDIIARYPASEAAGKARTRLASLKR